MNAKDRDLKDPILLGHSQDGLSSTVEIRLTVLRHGFSEYSKA
jgi:hypothetical protein